MSRFGLKPAQAPWARWCLGAASCLALPVASLHAQTPATPSAPSAATAPSAPKQATFERGGVDQVQATTQALLDALVDGGILTREKTDALVAAAKAKAAALVPFVGPDGSMLVMPPAPAPYLPVPSDPQSAGAGFPALPTVLPSASRAAAQEVDKDGKKVVRIPYVSETTKKELREQVKREVLAQAKKERWGDSGAYPSWLNHVALYGDFRLRQEATALAHGNTAPGSEYTYGDLTRAADISTSKGASGWPNFNTEDDSNRMRLRARLGLAATVSEDVTAALRFSTGNTTDRTSTNQTMGQSFNKYTVVFDQAYMSFRPLGPVAEFRGGRMPNPFFSTDLVWAEDLGFEGVSVSTKQVFGGTSEAFATAGYFPLSEFKPGTSRSRSVVGLQAGAAMKLGNSGQLKLGLALYDYQNVAGEREAPSDAYSRPDYATRYEYATGFRQRGNTLFNVKAPGDPTSFTAPVYGLASDFRVLNLTAVLDLPTMAGLPLTITGDAVTNTAFSRAAIAGRTGLTLTDGKEMGYLAKIALGDPTVRRKGEWNASLAYRYLGSDATLDAFTNSDFGLGGTNNQGFILGGNYGWYDNTVLSVRWMSANQIDSYAPGSNPVTKLSVDTLQVDLAVRF
jgi:hypothetical protein